MDNELRRADRRAPRTCKGEIDVNTLRRTFNKKGRAFALAAAMLGAGTLASPSAVAGLTSNCASAGFCTLLEVAGTAFGGEGKSFSMNGATFSNFSFDGATDFSFNDISVSLSDILLTPIEQTISQPLGFGFSLSLATGANPLAGFELPAIFLSYELSTLAETGGLSFAAAEFGQEVRDFGDQGGGGAFAEIELVDPSDFTTTLAPAIGADINTLIEDVINPLPTGIFSAGVLNSIFLETDSPFFLTQLFRTATFIPEPSSAALVLLAMLGVLASRRRLALRLTRFAATCSPAAVACAH